MPIGEILDRSLVKSFIEWWLSGFERIGSDRRERNEKGARRIRVQEHRAGPLLVFRSQNRKEMRRHGTAALDLSTLRGCL
jgi:hypothetical protein